MKLRSDTRTVALTAFVIVLCALLPVLLMNSGNLYLTGDHMTQQIPFIKECRRMILSGTPFWSHNTFFGANFIGTYSFYVYGSPFFWPLLLIPESWIGVGMSAMFILKHVVAAITSFLFLKNHVKTPHFAFIGALLYTFSSFTMDSTFYYHFIDVIAVFPLVLYFTDAVLENKKKPGLALAVLLNGLTNYYFLVATSVFFLIYLAFRIKFSDRYTWRDAVRCLVFYAIGGFASMVILLPSALCLLETDKATNSFSWTVLLTALGLPQILNILKGIVLPGEGVLGSGTGFIYTWFNYCSNRAFLPFFGAVFLFAAMRRKEKQWDYRLSKFLFIISMIPLINGAFSMFTTVSYTRWWYAFVLIAIVASVHILEDYQHIREAALAEYRKSFKTIVKIAAVVLGVPLIIKILCAYVLTDWLWATLPAEWMELANEHAKLAVPFDFEDLQYLIVLVLMTAVSYAPLYMSVKRGWIYQAKKVVPVVAVICAVSYCAYLSNESQVFTGNKALTYEGADVAQTDTVLYESRTQYDKELDNYSLVSNRPGVHTFHSFKSHATSQFCRIVGYEIGFAPETPAYYDTPAIQTVLSIETLCDEYDAETVAPYYTPFGYVYEYYVLDEGYEFTTDVAENNARIERMTKACYLDAETAQALESVLEPLGEDTVDWEAACAEAKETAATSFEMTSSGFRATSTGTSERLLYFSIPHDSGWSATVNGVETEIYTVNGGMMGIVVPAGDVTITFSFVPPGLIAGAVVSGVTLAGLAVYAVVAAVRRKKENS